MKNQFSAIKYFKIPMAGGYTVGESKYNPYTSNGVAFINGVEISKATYYKLRKRLQNIKNKC